eukprot:Rmarinus@m.5548
MASQYVFGPHPESGGGVPGKPEKFSSQNLCSIINNPEAIEWEWPEFLTIPAPNRSKPDNSPFHFAEFYLRNISIPHRFFHYRHQNELSKDELSAMERAEVDRLPQFLFKKEFMMSDPDTFQSVMQLSRASANAHEESDTVQVHMGNDSDASVVPHDAARIFGPPQQVPDVVAVLEEHASLVEHVLVRRLVAKTEQFFRAHREMLRVHDEVKRAVGCIRVLRGQMANLERDLVGQVSRVGEIRSERARATQLLHRLTLMRRASHVHSAIQINLSVCNYVGALDEIADTEKLLSHELSGIQCLRHVPSVLTEMVQLVSRMVAMDFLAFLEKALPSPADVLGLRVKKHGPGPCVDANAIESVESSLNRDGSLTPTNGSHGESESVLGQARIRARMEGTDIEELALSLVRLDMVHASLGQWQERVGEKIKEVIRESVSNDLLDLVPSPDAPPLPTSSPPVDQSVDASGAVTLRGVTTAVLSEQLRTMNQDRFLQTLGNVFAAVLALLPPVLEMYDAVRRVFVDAVRPLVPLSTAVTPQQPPCNLKEGECGGGYGSDSGGSDDGAGPGLLCPLSASSLHKAVSDVDEAMAGAIESVFDRCARLVNCRGAIHSRLTHDELLSVHRLCRVFEEKCLSALDEEHLNRAVQPLRTAVNNMVKCMLDEVHDKQKRKLVLVLDHELWSQVDVPPEFQQLVRELEKCDDSLCSPVAAARVSVSASPDSPAEAPRRPDDNTTGVLRLRSGVRFSVVGCALVLLKTLVDYLKLATTLPAPAAVLVARYIADYLRSYETKARELVFAAGALKTAGLKNITAKHLALAAQCAELLHMLLHPMEKTLRAVLPDEDADVLLEVDSVRALLSRHRDDALHHVAEMMKERIAVHSVMIQESSIENSRNSQFSPQPPSAHVRSLVKDTSMLHKILATTLPGHQLQRVFDDIVPHFSRILIDKLSAVENRSASAKEQLRGDLQYLMSSITGLDSIGRTLPDLDIFIASKLS